MPPPSPTHPREPPLRILAYFALLLVGLYLVAGPRVELAKWRVEPGGNAALEEAIRWKQGRLDVEMTDYEVTTLNGKRYNVVGLAFTIISVLATTLNNWVGGRPDEFFPTHYVLIVALPLPLVGFWAFRRATGSSPHAALLTAYLIAGTALLPVVRMCQVGSIYMVNHVLAVVGLLIFADDLLGPRRIWPAGLGLLLAAWSRQLTTLYALPLLWFALQSRLGNAPPDVPTDASRKPFSQSRRGGQVSILNHQFLIASAFALATLAGPMTLSYLKFGNPFDTGYTGAMLTHHDPVGRRAHDKLFSTSYIKYHLLAMNVDYPLWDIRAGTLYPLRDHLNGGAIWLTSPLFLAVFVTAPKWWRDPRRRLLMLSTLPVIAALMCYHTTGCEGSGSYRYFLDYAPIWLLVIAPYLTTPRATRWTVACLAYSALYFNLITI